MGIRPTLNCPCGEETRSTAIIFRERPTGETSFPLGAQDYERRYEQCYTCSHFFGRHEIDLTNLYRGAYTNVTYQNGIRSAFDRIMALPSHMSDNAGRVDRIQDFFQRYGKGLHERKLLDIGSGLAVFPAKMNELGWNCSVVDPDPRAVRHAEEVSGAQGHCGTFEEVRIDLDSNFSLITLNKVLEHIENPMGLLPQVRSHLHDGGFLYVEVPDAPRALRNGSEREEFFIEHHHGFSRQSLEGLIERSGFSPLEIHSISEPSGKFTVALFSQANA